MRLVSPVLQMKVDTARKRNTKIREKNLQRVGFHFKLYETLLLPGR